MLRSPYIRARAHRPLALAGAVLLGAGMIASEARADDAGISGGGATELEALDVHGHKLDPYAGVVSLEKLPGDKLDTPQQITVVTDDLLADQQVTTVREALRNVPGVTLAAAEGGAQGDNLFIRGFAARTDIYLDGARDTGQYQRDPFNLQSIEVLKGPSSVLFGRGSTGGVVNQVSKTPGSEREIEATVQAGAPDFARATADINIPFSGSALRLNLMATSADSTRDVVRQERWAAAPSVTFGLNGPTTFTASYFYLKDDNVPDAGLPYYFGRPAPVDEDNFYGLESDYDRNEVNIATGILRHQFDDRTAVRSLLRYGTFDRDLSPTAPRLAAGFTPRTPLDAIVVNRARPDRLGEEMSLVSQTDLTWNARFGDFEHKVLAGVEFGRETAETTRFTVTGSPPTLLTAPRPSDAASLVRTPNTYSEGQGDTAAAYILDQITWRDRWIVSAGLRWDRFAASTDTLAIASGLAQHFEHTDTNLATRLGVTFKPDADSSVYVAYATSFNPSGEALALSGSNNDLKPEKNRSFEVGVGRRIFDGLTVRAAAFRIEKTNARTVDPIDTTVQVLAGLIRVDGVEFEAVGRVNDHWDVFAGFTLVDPEIVESNDIQGGIPVEGKDPQNTAHMSANLWTTYQLTPKLQLGGGLTFVGQSFGNNANTNAVPGHLLADLTAAYDIGKATVRLNVTNLTDERWYSAVYTGHVVPGEGRRVVLGVSYDF